MDFERVGLALYIVSLQLNDVVDACTLLMTCKASYKYRHNIIDKFTDIIVFRSSGTDEIICTNYLVNGNLHRENGKPASISKKDGPMYFRFGRRTTEKGEYMYIDNKKVR